MKFVTLDSLSPSDRKAILSEVERLLNIYDYGTVKFALMDFVHKEGVFDPQNLSKVYMVEHRYDNPCYNTHTSYFRTIEEARQHVAVLKTKTTYNYEDMRNGVEDHSIFLTVQKLIKVDHHIRPVDCETVRVDVRFDGIVPIADNSAIGLDIASLFEFEIDDDLPF